LLVAKKCEPEEEAKTVIAVLKRLPKTLAEARAFASSIRNSKDDLENESLSVRVFPYLKLKKNINNWFKWISVNNLDLIEILEELLSLRKLTKLSSVSSIIRGYELRSGLVQKLIINTSGERAFKSEDIWILTNKTDEDVEFRHKFLSELKFKAPRICLERTLRRAAGIDKIDITTELDYVIIKPWDEKIFKKFEKIIRVKLSGAILDSIERDIQRRKSHLFVVRRLDLSAPRTYALAFYSQKPAAPVKLLWSLKCNAEDAKIINLFLNSTINLLQVLLQRAETRGAFIGLPEYILQDFSIPDPSSLSIKERGVLISLFERVKDVRLPSILEQLRTKHPVRRSIDRAWLKVLGYKGDADSLLDKLYKSLADEILLLKRLMKEGV